MTDTIPPMMRQRDIKKYFGREIPQEELRDLEERELIHPFRKSPNARRWYRSAEFQILFGKPV